MRSRMVNLSGDSAPGEAGLPAPVALPWLDPALVAVPLMASLFNKQLLFLTPVLMLASLLLILWTRLPRLPAAASRCFPVLLLGLTALASVIWSIDPGSSLRYGFLYLVTVALGVLLASTTDRKALLTGIFIAFAVFSIASWLFGRWVPWGLSGRAFAGLSPSKNMSGQVSGIAILAALAMIVHALKGRRLLLLGLALVTIPIALSNLYFARSTGAMIATGLGAFVILGFFAFRHLPRTGRTTAFIALLAIAVPALLLKGFWFDPLFDQIIVASGKDPGLTGRGFLWSRADELIAQRPALGVGFGAFWVQGNLDAEGLWRFAGIGSRSGFHFHNTPREIMIHLGVAGLALYAVVALLSVGSLLWRTILEPSATRILFCGLATFFLSALSFELVGFGTMNFATVLAMTTLAYGLAPDIAPQPRLPGHGELPLRGRDWAASPARAFSFDRGRSLREPLR